MRQLRYGAGGFSYKSMWTSQELFPLLILNCKFSSCTKKREQINTIRCEFGSKAHKRGIPSTTRTSQPPEEMDKKEKERGVMKRGKNDE